MNQSATAEPSDSNLKEEYVFYSVPILSESRQTAQHGRTQTTQTITQYDFGKAMKHVLRLSRKERYQNRQYVSMPVSALVATALATVALRFYFGSWQIEFLWLWLSGAALVGSLFGVNPKDRLFEEKETQANKDRSARNLNLKLIDEDEWQNFLGQFRTEASPPTSDAGLFCPACGYVNRNTRFSTGFSTLLQAIPCQRCGNQITLPK